MNFINNLTQSLRWLVMLVACLGLSAIQAKETTSYIYVDVLGSPIAAANASGAVIWEERYAPYGERTSSNATANGAVNSLWFTGHAEDKDTDLTYMGARWYDPILGRFMGVDPVGVSLNNVHSFNRYAYANNNPYRYVDPDGENPVDIVFAVADFFSFGAAVFTGVGIAPAAIDLGISVAQIFNPIPFVGQGVKIAHQASRGAKGTINDAIQSRDAAVSAIRQLSKTKQEKVSTVVGGVNTKTGEVAVGFKVRGQCNGMCAEDVVTKALGGNPKDVILTPAIRPKIRPHKSDVVPVCKRCQGTYSRDQFPSGTTFE